MKAAQDWQTFSSTKGNLIDELPGRAGATLVHRFRETGHLRGIHLACDALYPDF
jgi:hypothetical protein